MKSSLTNRDKSLLLFLFLFVVIVGIGYWGIYPQVKAFIKLENKIANEEVKKSVNEQKVANLGFVEAQCDEYEKSMAVNKEKFFDRMTEADIDLLLTGKAIKNKLESFSLNIDIPDTPSQRKAYIYSELLPKQMEWESQVAASEKAFSETEEEDDLLGLTGKTKKKDDEEEETVVVDETIDVFGDVDAVGVNNDIYAAKVTMVLGGDKKNLEAFLEELMNSDKEILITSFAWSKYRVQRTKDGVILEDLQNNVDNVEVVELDALTVTMELYMCDKD